MAEAPLSVAVSFCVMRVTPSGREDGRRINTFHVYIKSEDKFRKLIIDGGNSLNMLSKSTLQKMKIKVTSPTTIEGHLGRHLCLLSRYVGPYSVSSHEDAFSVI